MINTPQTPGQVQRKPRIMVAGEFSAGKSQLINGLLGKTLLPSNVTSTSLPPIWVIKGEGQGFRIDIKGRVHPFEGFENIEVEDTLFCLVHDDSPALEAFDLIDTPGNSDPNIPPECWERMLEFADTVVWCSNSVQAWRQSEKSVWKEIDGRLRQHATIVMTHADRLQNDGSDEKVMRRVKRDAKDFFSYFVMASLINADDVAQIRGLIDEEIIPSLPLTGAYQTDVEESRRMGKKPTGPVVQPRRPSRRRGAAGEGAPAETAQPPVEQAVIAPTIAPASQQVTAPAPAAGDNSPEAAIAGAMAFAGLSGASFATSAPEEPAAETEVAEAEVDTAASDIVDVPADALELEDTLELEDAVEFDAEAPAEETPSDDSVDIENVVDLFREAGEMEGGAQSPAKALWADVTQDMPLETVVDWSRAAQAYFAAVDEKLLPSEEAVVNETGDTVVLDQSAQFAPAHAKE